MKDTIFNLLPSHALKSRIREVGYELTEKELLFILFEYAPTFDERLALLECFAETASPETKETAELIMAWQNGVVPLLYPKSGSGEVHRRQWSRAVRNQFPVGRRSCRVPVRGSPGFPCRTVPQL